MVFAYLSSLAPSRYVLALGLRLLPYPKYEGFAGAFLPHAMLYSTLTAVVCGIFWYVLWRTKLLPPPMLAMGTATHAWGAGAGPAASILTLLIVGTTSPPGTLSQTATKSSSSAASC